MKRLALFLAVNAGMIRKFGFALIVFGIFSIVAAGSARAWPRAGMVGHISHGPAWNREPVAEQGAKIDSRETVVTGNLPEGSQSRSYGNENMADGKKLDRQYSDVGP